MLFGMNASPDLLAVYGAVLSTALAVYMIWKDWWLRRPKLLVTVEKQVTPDALPYTSYYLVQAVNHSNRPVRVLHLHVETQPRGEAERPSAFSFMAAPVQLAGGPDGPRMSIGTRGATIPGTLGPGDAGMNWVPADVIEPLLGRRPFVATATVSTGQRFRSDPDRMNVRYVVADADST